MTKKVQLLQRLNQIAASLAATGQALALLGLGSAGSEMERMDDYSDLDFFAIVRDGQKQAFLQNLDWLANIAPIAYAFMNTDDGFKVLYADEIFLEFAVFETAELQGISFAAEKIIWQDEDFDASILQPTAKDPKSVAVEWALGEALTNLYVGMARYRRGEKLTALCFVQSYAVDRVLDLASLLETEQPAYRDQFGNERRFEQRFPQTAVLLPQFMQGYDKTPQSAQAILEFLDTNFAINQAIKKATLHLISEEK
jgi:lincosamide nucleotidyltransferase B/F